MLQKKRLTCLDDLNTVSVFGGPLKGSGTYVGTGTNEGNKTPDICRHVLQRQ